MNITLFSELKILIFLCFLLGCFSTLQGQTSWTGNSLIGTASRDDRVAIGLHPDLFIHTPFEQLGDPDERANLIVSAFGMFQSPDGLYTGVNDGRMLYHWSGGQVNRFTSNDQWIGIGQPRIEPLKRALVPTYGIRTQWKGNATYYGLEQNGDALLQWGGSTTNRFRIEFLNSYRSPNRPAQRTRIIEFNSNGNAYMGGWLFFRIPEAKLNISNSDQGSNHNIGLWALGADGDQFNTGIEGTAISIRTPGQVTNYGVLGSTISKPNDINYAILGRVDHNNSTSYAGYFDGNVNVTGNFTQASDERLKKDIQPLDKTGSALDVINAVRPVSYRFKSKAELDAAGFEGFVAPDGFKFGFLAQQLQQVFNDLLPAQKGQGIVYEQYVSAPRISQDGQILENEGLIEYQYLGVDQSALIPFLVGAIQELSNGTEKREAQNQKVETLEAEVQTLGTELEAVKAQMARMEELMMAMMQERVADPKNNSNEIEVGKLEQNRPNPFTNNTRIGYQLPATAQNGRLIVYDLQGTQVAEFNNLNAGKNSVMLEGNSLQAGIYLYALMVNGKVVSVKRMVLTR